ncbi:MAG: hypothetical protein QNJ72_44685 [Pleurocapsa sp. MO_226.B13]|nr:hypothetical protein [Pleurocapsa sp. MO_226.B13]
MKTFLIICSSFFLFSTQAYARCNDLTGNYSYLGGRGSATITHSGRNVTIIMRWQDGGEYLIRAYRNGSELTGDWAFIRNRGNNVENPTFYDYTGQINLDCSIVGRRLSRDPSERKRPGAVLTPID